MPCKTSAASQAHGVCSKIEGDSIFEQFILKPTGRTNRKSKWRPRPNAIECVDAVILKRHERFIGDEKIAAIRHGQEVKTLQLGNQARKQSPKPVLRPGRAQ